MTGNIDRAKQIEIWGLVIGIMALIVAIMSLYWETILSPFLSTPLPEVSTLLCNNRKEPINLDTLTPTLSWSISTTRSYGDPTETHIEVGTQPERSDMWRYTLKGPQDNVVYNCDNKGKPLQWGKTYYWRVRVTMSEHDYKTSWKRGTFQLRQKETDVQGGGKGNSKKEGNESTYISPSPIRKWPPAFSKIILKSSLGDMIESSVCKEAEHRLLAIIQGTIGKDPNGIKQIEMIFKERDNKPPQQILAGRQYMYTLSLIMDFEHKTIIIPPVYTTASTVQDAFISLVQKISGDLPQVLQKQMR